MAVGEVIEEVRRIAKDVRSVRGVVREAAAALYESGRLVAAATDGTNHADVRAAVDVMTHTSRCLDAVVQILDTVVRLLDGYVERIAGSAGSRSQHNASNETTRVEVLRQQLPPRVGRGQKTRGRWFAPDIAATSVVSGEDERSQRVHEVLKLEGCPKLPVSAAADVELKLAVHMRDNRIREAIVVINNTPCTGPYGCDELVPVILPEGYSLTVYGPGGFTRRYEGGVKPW